MTIDYFATLGQSGGRFPDLTDTDAVTTCYHYLVATGHKKLKDTGGDALRTVWSKKRLSVSIPEPDAALWQSIAAPTIDLTFLPPYSFSLSFTFRLAQPYLSKDDNPFYIIDNPIARDKVFHLPMVRPSSWKGSLRHALWQLGARHDGKEYCDERVKRLFGETRDNDTGQSGRLFFYPTFFDRIGLDIINPHDRERRVGKNPILFECVPSEASGQFTLLYTPLDCIGADAAETRRQVLADLQLLAQGLEAMFTLYGFGAKTSSGFGLAKENLVGEGRFVVNIAEPIPQAAEVETADSDAAEQLQADIAHFIQRFELDEFPHWTNEEVAKSGWGSKRQSEYKRLRLRHPDWDADADRWREAEQETVADEVEVPAPLTSRSFASFAVLPAIIASLPWPKEQTR